MYVLDLQLSKTFRVGSAVTVIPEFDCFNLLNSHTVLARQRDVGVYDAAARTCDCFPDFNAVSETLSGRTFRGGVRIAF